MLNFRLIYSDGYYLPIGAHVFPAEKYRGVRERLLATGLATPADFVEPEPATDEDILRVHTPEYVRKLKQGGLSPAEELAMEIPYSAELVRAFWLAAGGSILAAECALGTGVAINVGGGFHHAFPDHGEGFCMIHDVAVAIRRLEHDAKISRTMVVDCDVHQGNGTAAMFPNPLASGPSPAFALGREAAGVVAPTAFASSASPQTGAGRGLHNLSCISRTTTRRRSRPPPLT
jgi:acetoin utilization deacetylase AcuC-like enzyme